MAILIDNTPKEDGRQSLSKRVSDINQARADLDRQNSILQKAVNSYDGRSGDEIRNAMQSFETSAKQFFDNLEKMSKSASEEAKQEAKATKAFLSELGYTEKAVKKLSQSYRDSDVALQRMIDSRNATGDQLLDTVQSLDDAQESIAMVTAVLDALTHAGGKLNDQLEKNIKNEHAINQATHREMQQARQEEKTRYQNNEKVAGQSKFQAVVKEADNLARNIKDLVNTFNINRLAQDLAPTTKQQIQSEIQTTYGLSAKEFEGFKKDLYSQIDKTVYSADEVNAAINTLNTTALGNTQTATKYFNDIIRGQKVLGISSESQQRLLKLGNITGRNELIFFQGTVAKFLNSNLGLNKKQLDELVQMNANLSMQAADLGIATEEFERMNMIESGAMEKTSTGFGAKFTQMESTLLANTNTTASLLGMDSGELSGRLARGESLIDIIRNSNGGAKAAMNVLANGSAEDQTRMYEHAKEAWGVDANTWSVLRVIAQQGSELDKNLLTATEASGQDTQEAIDELTKKSTESLTGLQKAVNAAGNWINEKIPWSVEATLKSIAVGVFAILASLQAFGSISQIIQAFTGGGGGGGLLKGLGKGAAGGKIASWLGSTSMGAKTFGGAAMTNGAALGGGLSLAGGLIWSGIDAYKGYNTTSELLYGSNATTGEKWKAAGLTAFSGSGIKYDENGKVSKGKNVLSGTLSGAGKGALIGAGIGTFFGPGVGTAIGAAVGGLIGGAIGGVTGSVKADKAREEQQKTLEEIKENTKKTADNTKADKLNGVVYRYRGTDNYSSAGAPTGNGYIGSILSTAANGYGIGMPEGIHVNSPYGARNPIKLNNGKYSSSFHNGIDLRASEGTPLYSNVNGTVSMNLTEKSGCNIVGVTDAQGYTHLYAHMQSKSPLKVGTPVYQGQFVGYAGKTGGVTGAHLHYSVVKPGKTGTYWQQDSVIDPTPFITSSIFSGQASSIIATSNALSAAPISANAGPTNKITLAALGDVSGPIVGSITDLKQTIIDLSTKTDRNEKILNMLTNRNTPSPIV